MKPIRLFLTDDHAMFRKAMRIFLEQQPDMSIVGEAGTGEATLDQLAACRPELLLLDISLPDIPGTVVARRALKRFPELLIIVLTMHQEEYYAQDMIRLGVKGFVLKRSTGDELLEAIHRVKDGGAYWDPAVIEDAVSAFAGTPRKAPLDSGLTALTSREREVCRFLAHGHTNSEIATLLSISVRTVQTHRQHIMGKLHITSRAELVTFAMRNGLFTPSQ
ncbi:MAG: response regulator transcription factor [Verrucomicrobia bacterium]|jgi:two-component system, NarL family, response regulator NreC|nr:response regulator transcription factor [Verrucomicrobiota bacterium]MBT7066327.1 response regulator transcription factor [Verrucomicrobiota bacterium]MBT7700219.1 response regulator transcription factor [Verrucomicrobiota bacterium]